MRYPSWEGPLTEALAETDMKRLAEKVSAAEDAIFQRSRDIAPAADAEDERQAIQIALRDLLRIKTEKLGWPGIGSEDSGSKDR
jgi:hypothetical protein